MITLRAFGGLGNRIFAIHSMINLCEKLNHDLHIIWQLNHDLNAGYNDLFLPLKSEKISISLEEHTTRKFIYSDRVLNNLRQRVFNRTLKIYQSFKYDKVIHAQEMKRMLQMGYSLDFLEDYTNAYITFWGRMDQDPFSPEMFQLIPRLKSKIPTIDPSSIGMHIRRTDHCDAIEVSPVENYYYVVHKELEVNPDINFFLASDSAAIKKDFKSKFGKSIRTLDDDETDRNSLSGIENAVCDLYSLAQTSKIYGSSRSTFALLASEIHSVPFQDISSIKS